MTIFLIILAVIVLLILLFVIMVIKRPPQISKSGIPKNSSVEKVNDNLYTHGSHFLHKNKFGLWELSVGGTPYEIGLINGMLTKELIYLQEKYFVGEIKKIITNRIYINFLKLLVAFMNRKLNKFIGEEYNQEIFGISRSASKEFALIGPGYQRLLNYHAAHDIGHTLEYMKFVGCTSFALWGSRTADGKVIHARNFDFHVGDEFSKDKIVTFYRPEKGFPFMMITWGGMIGTVSGMNAKGIAITVNAAKSKLPLKSSTPITILVRKMLQYAATLQEAKDIAVGTQIFVSESIHVSSGPENISILIEKTPYTTHFFEPNDMLVCTNHFQSEALKNEKSNLAQIHESSSMKRHERTSQLINAYDKISVERAVKILRDRQGLNDENIGLGNELAVNQLIAHHGIVFKPDELKCWVSANPYSCGAFVCYDLKKIWTETTSASIENTLYSESECIAEDEFASTKEFADFMKFKELRKFIADCKVYELGRTFAEQLIHTNPESYLAYSDAGDFYKRCKLYEKALQTYQTGLLKAIPTLKEKEHIENGIKYCLKKLS